MTTKTKDRTGAGSRVRQLLETSALAVVFSSALLAAGIGTAHAGGSDNPQIIGQPLEYEWTLSAGVSGNGKVIVGSGTFSGGQQAIRWSADNDWEALEGLSIYTRVSAMAAILSSAAFAVNNDGSVVVGAAQTWDGAHAVRWTNGEIDDLGGLMNAAGSVAMGVSGDGSIIAGYSEFGTTGNSNSPVSQAFRWKGNMQALDGLNGDVTSKAYGISRDGSTIVGVANDGDNDNTQTAVSWTDEGQQINSLGNLGSWSSATAADSDGSVIVGSAGVGAGTHAFRWADGDMRDIDLLNGRYSVANAVSGNGSVVVGKVAFGTEDHAFRWTEATGMQTVEEWLSATVTGIDQEFTEDFTRTATGISEDGNVIVGDTDEGGIFIARGGSGIIDVEKYNTTLAAKPSAQVGLGYANTVLQGAHGEPMRDLLGLGQRSVAFTSDIGYDDSRVSNGGVGIGDITFGYGIAEGVTARFAGGGLYTKQDIETGGDFHQAAFYMAPEATIVLGSSNVYATIGGYYSTGRMDIHRGYQNGAGMDYSHGETDVQTYGAKVRFDWLNAATIADTKLTPYASLTYAHSHMDDYTEEGGSFPSAFDSANDHSTVARIGIDYIHDLTQTVRLTARTEVDYRFEKHTAGTSGEIVGLSAFEFAGENVKQLWLRGAIGTEFDVAGGTASLGVNVTTEGDDPNVWLRSGWNVKF